MLNEAFKVVHSGEPLWPMGLCFFFFHILSNNIDTVYGMSSGYWEITTVFTFVPQPKERGVVGGGGTYCFWSGSRRRQRLVASFLDSYF